MNDLLEAIINEAGQNSDKAYGILGNESEEIMQTLRKLERLGLIKQVMQGYYELTQQGERAYAMGGFKKWQEATGRIS